MKDRFYTNTLASLYAKQGYYDEAEKGFKSLLKKEPGRADYRDKLLELSRLKKEKTKADVVGLVSEWVQLLKKEQIKDQHGIG